MTIAATPVTRTVSSAAQSIIGDRPVMEFSLKAGERTLRDIEGNATLSIPYKLQPGEDPSNLVIVQIVRGVPVVITDVIYENGMISWVGSPNGTYGVGYDS